MSALNQVLSIITKRLATRNQSGPLRRASSFSSRLLPCLTDDSCACEIKDLATWKRRLESMHGQLAWLDDSMLITRRKRVGGSTLTFPTREGKDNSAPSSEIETEGLPQTPGSVMDFECVLSSTKEDREGDIIEAKGIDLDPSSPLLWQHLPVTPLGRLIRETHRDDDHVRVHCAIADTLLGRDAAVLVEFKALRISHGFVPIEIEELPMKAGAAEGEGGFHIKRCKVYEVSLVSIPANEDATILAFSRGKLFHPVIKSYAKSLWQGKPVTVRSGFEPKGDDGAALVPATPTLPTKRLQEGIPAHKDLVTRTKLAGLPRRWNRRLSKSFDVKAAPLEPHSLAYDWISRFLGVPIKHIYTVTQSVSGARMGSWLTGLKNTLAQKTFQCQDVRNIENNGTEAPPKYEVVQLNSQLSDSFLVEGYAFYSSSEIPGVVIRSSPGWGGLDVQVFGDQKHAEAINKLLTDTSEWAKFHNFLKGEAFSLGGEFLPKSGEQWEDLFLEPQNEKALKRVMKRLNEKQINFKNHGMVMTGPPGTGKTLSGRILRNQAKATFIWVSARDFHYSGAFGGLQQAWGLAKELAPAIVFIEDVDNWLDSWTIDYVKTEMDGIGRSTGILTILTTNFPERLPEALLDRPGRFNDVLHFGLPSDQQRSKMLTKWLPGIQPAPLLEATKATKGFAGAHIYHLCEYARTLEETEEVDRKDSVNMAIQKVAEQRALIDAIQLEGSNYQPHKALSGMVRKGNTMAATTKSPAPKKKSCAKAGCKKQGCGGTCGTKGVKGKGDFKVGDKVQSPLGAIYKLTRWTGGVWVGEVVGYAPGSQAEADGWPGIGDVLNVDVDAATPVKAVPTEAKKEIQSSNKVSATCQEPGCQMQFALDETLPAEQFQAQACPGCQSTNWDVSETQDKDATVLLPLAIGLLGIGVHQAYDALFGDDDEEDEAETDEGEKGTKAKSSRESPETPYGVSWQPPALLIGNADETAREVPQARYNQGAWFSSEKERDSYFDYLQSEGMAPIKLGKSLAVKRNGENDFHCNACGQDFILPDGEDEESRYDDGGEEVCPHCGSTDVDGWDAGMETAVKSVAQNPNDGKWYVIYQGKPIAGPYETQDEAEQEQYRLMTIQQMGKNMETTKGMIATCNSCGQAFNINDDVIGDDFFDTPCPECGSTDWTPEKGMKGDKQAKTTKGQVETCEHCQGQGYFDANGKPDPEGSVVCVNCGGLGDYEVNSGDPERIKETEVVEEQKWAIQCNECGGIWNNVDSPSACPKCGAAAPQYSTSAKSFTTRAREDGRWEVVNSETGAVFLGPYADKSDAEDAAREANGSKAKAVDDVTGPAPTGGMIDCPCGQPYQTSDVTNPRPCPACGSRDGTPAAKSKRKTQPKGKQAMYVKSLSKKNVSSLTRATKLITAATDHDEMAESDIAKSMLLGALRHIKEVLPDETPAESKEVKAAKGVFTEGDRVHTSNGEGIITDDSRGDEVLVQLDSGDQGWYNIADITGLLPGQASLKAADHGMGGWYNAICEDCDAMWMPDSESDPVPTICPECGKTNVTLNFKGLKEAELGEENPDTKVEGEVNPGIPVEKCAVILLSKLFAGKRPSWETMLALRGQLNTAIKAMDERAALQLVRRSTATKAMVQCPDCNGTGEDHDRPYIDNSGNETDGFEDCALCGGSGTLDKSTKADDDDDYQEETCSQCNGTGKMESMLESGDTEMVPCDACRGQGVVEKALKAPGDAFFASGPFDVEEQDDGTWAVVDDSGAIVSQHMSERDADNRSAELNQEHFDSTRSGKEVEVTDEGEVVDEQAEVEAPEEPEEELAPTLADLTSTVKYLAKQDPDMPREAKDRLMVVAGMLSSIQSDISDYARQLKGAAKDNDIETLLGGRDELVTALARRLDTIADDLDKVMGVDGIEEESMTKLQGARQHVASLRGSLEGDEGDMQEKGTKAGFRMRWICDGCGVAAYTTSEAADSDPAPPAICNACDGTKFTLDSVADKGTKARSTKEPGDIDDPVDLDDLLEGVVDEKAQGSPEWDEGYQARQEGKTRNESPYEQGTPEGSDWVGGWDARLREERRSTVVAY